MKQIHSISTTALEKKRILLRVDYNVSLTEKGNISNDERITQTIPTLELLLKQHNKLIIISHLGRPKGREEKYSLEVVVKRLQKFFPGYTVSLVSNFLSTIGQNQLANQDEKEILVLENIRFYEAEQENDHAFAKALSGLADVFVNDAFGVCHRSDASVVGIPHFLPSYAGLLLSKEIESISAITNHPKKPVVAILGGAKTSTKIPLLFKLTEIADFLLLGGGIANTFLHAQGVDVKDSLMEKDQEKNVESIITHARQKQTTIILPTDAVVAKTPQSRVGIVCRNETLPEGSRILDIGPDTQARFGSIIAQARTIIWNGPVGLSENPAFSRGTDFLYYAITQNTQAFSVVGGGDTLAAISKKEYLDKITHISTGGGAMLEFIENGTLPGIEVLKQ